jgi:hypothetical protein
MANLILKEGANPNYLATICQIGETHNIEGADKIQKVVINGYDMVISKEMKAGDIVVYFPIESAISEKYLSANNLYEISEYERNSNMKDVAAILAKAEGLIESGKVKEGKAVKDEAKKMVGFFNKRGRVRILKLRGISSEGFVAGVDSLEKAYPSLVGTDWNSLIGTKFNYVDDEELCWKYIPPIKVVEPQTNGKQGFFKKRMKRLKRFDKLIPGTFVFHYDTKKLNECIDALSPQDIVTISVKVHGCVKVDTIVDTLEHGQLTIGDIVNNKKECHIKAYDTDTDSIVYVPIDNFYTIPNDGEWYEIELENGKKITITGNNPIYIPEINAYRRVDELIGNEKILFSED